MYRIRMTLFSLGAMLVMACSSGTSSDSTTAPRGVLTSDMLLETQESDLYAAVQRLRYKSRIHRPDPRPYLTHPHWQANLHGQRQTGSAFCVSSEAVVNDPQQGSGVCCVTSRKVKIAIGQACP